MKKIIYSLFLISIISSCEVIEGPYMNGNGGGVDTNSNQYVKNILIEEHRTYGKQIQKLSYSKHEIV